MFVRYTLSLDTFLHSRVHSHCPMYERHCIDAEIEESRSPSRSPSRAAPTRMALLNKTTVLSATARTVPCCPSSLDYLSPPFNIPNRTKHRAAQRGDNLTCRQSRVRTRAHPTRTTAPIRPNRGKGRGGCPCPARSAGGTSLPASRLPPAEQATSRRKAEAALRSQGKCVLA